MYLLYIDDSGTCELKKDEEYNVDGGNTRFFILGGILIKAHELNKIESKILSLKNTCLKNELNEIKYSVSKNLNCNLSCQKNNDKYCFRKKIASLLNDIDCTIFATVQDKYKTTTNNIVKNKDDIYRLCFEHILKSVDDFMYNNKIQEDTIVFIDKKDSGDHKDILIYNAYKSALSNNKIYRAFNNKIFAPSINIVYSQYTIGAQLADFIAGSVWAFYENSLDIERKERARFLTNSYSSKVYKKENKLLGLTHSNYFLT